MRTFDFTPLHRSAIGFDRMLDLLEDALRAPPSDDGPPYDIARTGDDAYRITMAVAGFGPDELTITQQQSTLVVTGRKAGEDAAYLHNGIRGGAFERRFDLADFVTVTGATLKNGLLSIDLVRELPEAMRPRRIAIDAGKAFGHRQTIEHAEAA